MNNNDSLNTSNNQNSQNISNNLSGLNNETVGANNMSNINSTNNLFNSSANSTISNNVNNTSSYMSDYSQMNKKNNKKNFIILGILLIVGCVVGILIFKYFNGNKSSVGLNFIFDPDNPIVVKNNNKFGYVSSEGKVMIEPQYDFAGPFYDKYAVVGMEVIEYDMDMMKYEIIDKSGKTVLNSDSSIAPVFYPENNIWEFDNKIYDKNLKLIFSENLDVDYLIGDYFIYSDYENNESGIIKYNGKKIYSAPVTHLHGEVSTDEYASDDIYISLTSYSGDGNRSVVSLKTGDVLFNIEGTSDNYLEAEENGIFYYYYDKDGYNGRKYLFFANNKLLFESTEKIYDLKVYDYDNLILEIDYGYDYDEMGKTKRRYYYDVKNKKMLSDAPSTNINIDDIDLVELTYGLKTFETSDKYGLMNGDKIVLSAEYDDIEFLNLDLYTYMKSNGKELFLLKKDDKTLVYNLKNSKVVTTFDSKYIYDYSDSTFIKADNGNGYIVYNLLTGMQVHFDKDAVLSFGPNYFTLKEGEKTSYYNVDCKKIYTGNK